MITNCIISTKLKIKNGEVTCSVLTTIVLITG